jgi:hypothetical protein
MLLYRKEPLPEDPRVEEEDEVEDEHEVVRGPEVLHASAYVSICQHMSAYVSIRQHATWKRLDLRK